MKTRQFMKANACGQTGSMNAVRGLLLILAMLMPVLSFAQGVPFIQELKPPSATVGSGDLSLTVTGVGFDSASKVNFAGSALACAITGTTQCTVTVPSAKFSAAGTAVVTLTNSGPKTSNTVLFPIATPQPPAFATELQAVGKTPQSVARGDFNGDGHQDLAVVNSGDNTVSILLGDGHGNFTLAAGSPVTVGHNPQGVAVGDFDNNGTLDLAVVNENDNNVSILLGNGVGTFVLQASPPATDIAPLSVAVADVEQDGNLDLLIVNQTGSGCTTGYGSLSILKGDGTGKFTPKATYCIGILASSLAVGDFNGDGWPDIAVNNAGGSNAASCAPGVGSVSILTNFSFLLPDAFALSSYCAGKGPTAVAAGDFNNDGILDLAVANVETNSITVSIGNGDGSFQPPISYDTGGGAVPTAFAVADFSGDGNLDLAVLNQGSSNVSLLLGNGDGTFQVPPPLYSTTVSGGGQSHGMGPVSIVAADLNEDGRLDLVTADSSDNFLSVLLQAPSVKSFCVSAAPSVQGNFGCSGPPQTTQPPLPPPPPLPLLTFGNQPDGTTSQVQMVKVTNTGSSSVALTTSSFMIVGGNFTFPVPNTSTCTSALAPGASCNVSVMFAPGSNALGSLSGSLQVSYNAGLSTPVTQTLATLSGTGIAPALGFSPLTVTFPATLVGTTSSSTQTVTVTNIGDFDVTLQGAIIGGTNPGDFMITATTCTGSLAAGVQGVSPGGSCPITVSFTPSLGGVRTALIDVSFIVAGGDPTNPIHGFVSLSGDGAAPFVNFAPTPLTFGSQQVGTASGPSIVTLLNDGTYALTINSITSSDPIQFTIQNNTCPGTLAVSTACTVSVVFAPTAVGTQNATLTFTDNNNAVNNSQQAVGLVGTGAGAIVSLAISPQTFGNQQIGTTSAPATVYLSNLGNGPLTINNVFSSDPGQFTIQNNNCPGTLAVSASCTVTVTFTPSAVGPRSGTLTFIDNNNAVNNSHQAVNLSGTGTAPAGSLIGLSGGNSLAFGGVPFHTTSAPLSFMLSNTGTAPLVINSILINTGANPGDFAQSSNCPNSLAANANCTISVTFTPSATGLRTATLTITDNNGGCPTCFVTQTVSLSGTGTNFTISVSPTTLTVSPGKFATYTLTLTPISGFTGTVTLGCNVVPALPKTTCTTPISVVVSSPNTMFLSASAKNSSKGTYTLSFFATFTATPPATGTLSVTPASTVLKVK